jgi:hypothetical protein
MKFKLPILFLIVTLFYFLQAPIGKRDIASDPGVFPDVEKLDESHEINSNIVVTDIEDFIELTSYDGHLCNDQYHGDNSKLDYPNSSNVLTKEELAQEIYDISLCFNIDPAIYAVLIYKESQFCNMGGTVAQNKKPILVARSRKSSTNAVGLTMFTSTAGREVHDQLYIPRPSKGEKARFHWRARPKLHNLMAKCGYASDYTFTSTKDYYKNKTWSNDVLYMSHKLSMSELKAPKKWKDQLLYGAVKLKISLSRHDQPDDYDVTKNSVSHYYKAIKRYNAAGGQQESEYWQYIFAGYEIAFDKSFKDLASKENISYSKTKWIKRQDSFMRAATKNNLKNNKIYNKIKD